MKDELMVQQQVENSWQHMVGVICLNQTGRKKVKEEDVPKNLCLRVSAIKVDSPPPKFWKWTSGVHKDKPAVGRECPAPKQNGECGSCRACWSRKVKQVSYKEH